MVVTNYPKENAFGNQVSVDASSPHHTPEIISFFGDQYAIRLVRRGRNDLHICYEVLQEDDGHWSASGGGASSAWLPEFIQVLQAAEQWLKENAVPDIVNEVQYGFRMSAKKE